jgi:hypothetical protein
MTDEIRDGDWTLVHHDAEMGRTVWHLHQDGMDHFRIDYEVEKTLEQAQAEFNSAPSGWAGDWHKVMTLPHNLLHSTGLDEANNQRDTKHIRRVLNDRDLSKFRTKGGNVG